MLRRLRAWLGGAPAKATAEAPRTPAQRRGQRAEDAALALLQDAGLVLVERNYLARGGEIDLVMREGGIRVFVEVRHRSGSAHGDGLDSVARAKQRRLLAAARQYLAEHPEAAREPLRFDVVASGAGGLRWVRDAFGSDEGGW